MISTPTSKAFMACLGDPIIFMTGIPAAWNFSTTHLGGTPTALTNNDAFSSIIISTNSGKVFLV